MIFYGVNFILDERFAKCNICIPAYFKDEYLVVYISDFTDKNAVKEKLYKKGITLYIFENKTENEIKRLINTYYSIEYHDKFIYEEIRKFIFENKNDILLEFILKKAIDFFASDIHIFKEKDYLVIRFRISGVLRTFCIIDGKYLDILGRIIKVKSNVDIAKTVKSIDSKFKFVDDKEIDIRVSIIKSVSGDKIALRILDDKNIPKSLKDLNLDCDIKSLILKNIKREHGMILSTGSTGSGKTTLIKCFLNELNDASKHIVSLENPIEYTIDGITQIYVDEKVSNFEDGLKSILRQDPDIIFIGEIRDKLSAEISMRSSITGHLVFSTLHTQTEKLAIDRLKNLGIEDSLLFNSISMILNQRLVSLLCDNCKEKILYNGEDIHDLSLKKGDYIYEAMGCEKCSYSGFLGRKLLISVLEINDSNRSSYIKDAECIPKSSITTLAIKEYKKGAISLSEVIKFL